MPKILEGKPKKGSAGDAEESMSSVLWMSALSGLAGVFVETVFVGGLYLFEPLSKGFIEDHSLYFLISLPILFVAGFGLSVAITLESQFRRGKWN